MGTPHLSNKSVEHTIWNTMEEFVLHHMISCSHMIVGGNHIVHIINVSDRGTVFLQTHFTG